MNAVTEAEPSDFQVGQATAAERSGTTIRVLLIEDDLIDELATLRVIDREKLPYAVQVARSLARATETLQTQTFDVILADYQLGDGTSFDLMDAFADQLVIFITGAWDPTAAARALRLGVHDYLIKDLEGHYLKLLHYRIETALRQRRLADQLRNSEARLQAILDNAPVSISARDRAGRLILSNRHHALHAATEPGVDPADIAHATRATRATSPSTPQESEVTHIEGDGCQHTYLSVRFDMPSASGQCEAVGTIAVDITERRRANEALLTAKAAAEAANAAKTAFLSNISHEIRTPLNAVIGITHLLAESGMTQDQRSLLHKAQLAGRALLGIVNDVLDLAKIEAGEITLDEGPYQPLALLKEIEAVYAPQAEEKGLSFTVTADPALPPWLQCDSSRLRQVLVNLVANALKFTRHGGIEVRLSLTDRSLDRCGLLVSVRDSGIGIESNVVDRLFSPFIQADASTTRRYGGTGLGLSIVRRLAQIMGGEVGVNSTLGQGSEFWVALPQTLPDIHSAASSSRGLMLLEVLVVDDSPMDRLVLTSQVRALGWQVVALDSGASLLSELARRAAAGLALPDIMLVDWQMPGMDGLQALAAASAQIAAPQVLPAALVVSAYERDRIARLDHAGLVDHILTKPVDSSALFNAVNESLARRQGSTDRVLCSTRVDGADTLWLAGMRVLLVDDSDINLEVAKRLLAGRGAHVQICASGPEALGCLRVKPAGFDAVLMDVQMPGMDGLEVTRRIRSDLGLQALPVIALTAGALVEERSRALEAGMQGFLSKPLDPIQLIRVLRGCVETARGTVLPVAGFAGRNAAVAMPATVSNPTPFGASAREPWPQLADIDAIDAAHRLGNDASLFQVLLRQMLVEFRDLSVAIDPALMLGNQRLVLTGRMHKLRGSAGTLGATRLRERAAAAETLLQHAAADADEAVAAVVVELGRLTAQFAARFPEAKARHEIPPIRDVRWAAELPAAESEKVRGLLRKLTSHDLSAIETFRTLTPLIRSVLGVKTEDALSRALESLDFERAASLLAPCLKHGEPGERPDWISAAAAAATD